MGINRHKKCDDCGSILVKGKNFHKAKFGRGFGMPKRYKGEDGTYMNTNVTIFYFCNDCYNFHNIRDGRDIEDGSPLDKLITKKLRYQPQIDNTSELEKKLKELKEENSS